MKGKILIGMNEKFDNSYGGSFKDEWKDYCDEEIVRKYN